MVGREYAAQHWPGLPVRVFADNSLSAARDDVRTQYDALRAAIRAGEVAHVWTVEQARLERRKVEWFQLAAEMITAGIDGVHSRRDGLIRLDDIGSDVRAIVNARYVSELKIKTRDKLGELARQGRPSGGTTFGYRRGVDDQGRKTLVIHPEEADAVRWAADALLRGWALVNIGRELHKRGFRGALGGDLRSPTSVRRLLGRPTIAGLRVHHGTVTAPGTWEAIIEPDTWRLVNARLDAPRAVATLDGGKRELGPAMLSQRVGRKYLLTGGLARCAVCDAAMIGRVHQSVRRAERKEPRRVANLFCPPRAKGGCGGVSILLEPTEDYVRDRLLDELDKPEFLAALTADDQAERRDELVRTLSALDAQRNELAEMWGAGVGMSTTEWQAARGGLDQRERTLRAELAAIPTPPGRVDIDDVRGAWPKMTLDERREVVRLFIERVIIAKAAPGTRAFDPGRIAIAWKLITD